MQIIVQDEHTHVTTHHGCPIPNEANNPNSNFKFQRIPFSLNYIPQQHNFGSPLNHPPTRKKNSMEINRIQLLVSTDPFHCFLVVEEQEILISGHKHCYMLQNLVVPVQELVLVMHQLVDNLEIDRINRKSLNEALN